MLLVFATTLALHPFDLVRVEDPSFPGADAVSATGAVLLEPPSPGTPWRHESVPVVDRWAATEAISALNADVWHDRGVTGAGVKVAVFDVQWYGAELRPEVLGDVSTHDCYQHRSCMPEMDTLRPRFGFEEGVHGYACAEVIRDIAPDAQLFLVRVNNGTTLENAVDWAIVEGIDVVSMSMSFFNSSFYDGSGPIATQVEKLAAAGVLLVTSAGNYAQQHWQGRFTDGDVDGRLDFDGDNGLPIYLRAGEGRGIYVNWNQHRSCGRTDLDAVLLDADGFVVGRSEDDQIAGADRCTPVERLRGYVEEDGWYRLEVTHRRGGVVDLEVNVIATDGVIDGAMPRGSIADPGVVPGVLTVGAVRAEGYLTNDVEGFSSWGPTAVGVPKPEIAGPDGLSTHAYGPIGFYGTSAATPAVAAAVALVMSDAPGLTPHQASERLQAWALSDAPLTSSPDPRWGAGKARLPAPDDEPTACGRRPLLLPIFLPPLAWWRRRKSG